MFRLLKYELKKLFWVNVNIYIISALVGLADVFYLSKIIEEKGGQNEKTFGIAMSVLMLFMIITMFFPAAKSIYQLVKDHNGYNAPLEAHIPYPGWMKILAKLLSSVVFILAGFAIAFFVLFTFSRIGPQELSREWDKQMTAIFNLFMNSVDMRRTVFSLLLVMFMYTMSILGLVALFTSLYGAWRNKVKHSKILAFVLGVLFFLVVVYMSDRFSAGIDHRLSYKSYDLVLNDLATRIQLYQTAFHSAVAVVCVFLSGWIFDRYSDID